MTYKHGNGRIQHRSAGRFRHSTLADIGMGLCERCGVIHTPDVSDLADQPFIDPRAFRERQAVCSECRAKEGAQQA